MFEIIQIGAKLVIIVAILLVAGFASLRVWRADIDLRRLLSPSRAVSQSAADSIKWLPTRQSDALYQDGQVVGIVEGVTIDEQHGLITFAKVGRAVALNVKGEMEYQRWRLKYERSDMEGTVSGLATQPDRGFGNMTCRIVGTRAF